MNKNMDSGWTFPPIIKATLQSAVLSAIGNVLGQVIKGWKAESVTISLLETAQFVLFSCLACPPNFLWQKWLERRWPGYTYARNNERSEDDKGIPLGGSSTATDFLGANGIVKERERATAMFKGSAPTMQSTGYTDSDKSRSSLATGKGKRKLNVKNTATKFALDQTVGAAANTIMFLAGIALIRAHSLAYAVQQVVEGFWPLIFAGQKMWPAVSVISFTLVPVERRTVFGSIVGVFWNVVVTLMHGGAQRSHGGAKKE